MRANGQNHVALVSDPIPTIQISTTYIQPLLEGVWTNGYALQHAGPVKNEQNSGYPSLALSQKSPLSPSLSEGDNSALTLYL